MIKNIILDMGNVLLKYDPEVSLNTFCDCAEAKDMIRRELFNGPEWAMGDRGDISDRDRYELVKHRVPEKYWEALKHCCDSWHICMTPLPGARELCGYIKERGLGIYLLTNASDAFYEYFPKFLPLDYFDGILVSADEHMLKPDVKIYERIAQKYSLIPGECLFVDDMPQNVEGAIKAGMQGYAFQNDYGPIMKMIEA